ncbi:MAG: hypothetical protein ACRC1W_01355 [Shewanella sp.]
MKQIKLTQLQENKLSDAVKNVYMLQNQARIIQSQLNSAANYQQSILEMIYESHGVDTNSITPATNVNLKDGYLTIGEVNASDRIKKDLKKTLNPHSNGKAKSNR